MGISREELLERIDLAILRPEASSREVHKIVTDAMQRRVRGVCTAPVWTARVATMVRGGPLRVCSAVAFPHGASKSTVKAIEATSTIKDGADEIEIVAHLPLLLGADLDAARGELMEIVRAARSTRRDVQIHVIIEIALLMPLGESHIETATRAVRESGCDGIVTSSGLHSAGGATVEAVRLLRRHSQGLLIKAAGNIDNAHGAVALLDAGADRLALTDLAVVGIV